MITFVDNKEAIYETDDYDVILVAASTHNAFMGNFQRKIGIKYPEVEKAYIRTPYADMRKLGKRLTINDLGDGKPIVSLMFMCTYPSRAKSYINYDALEKCLTTANSEFKGKKVMTTVLGTTRFDGNGDYDRCMEIINRCTKDLELYVYTYKQISVKEETDRQNAYFMNLREKLGGGKDVSELIMKLKIEMRHKTYLPTDLYIRKPHKRGTDNILVY